ncbi:MAG: hypothetical protein QOK07_2638 [Gemmatimonadaceae bacterium]|nr:hypothetical protein [Gemmatimonadaceae bacterium]
MKALALIPLAVAAGFGSIEAQVLPVNPAFAPSAAVASNEPGANLTVYLLTFGWGNEVWERFGHNAIWIKDRTRGTDLTYNWGMFSFDEPHFLTRFLTGDTRYWMQAFDLDTMLAEYRRRNRSVLAQELNLTPAQRLKLQQFVQWNELPQNKFYRYDYYRDNCSTRLRDALDHAVGGQLQTSTVTRITPGTYRFHTLRLLGDNIPLYTGADLALGHPADKPLSEWEEMFLPVRMANDLRTVRLTDSTGTQIPFVRSEMALFTAGRPPEPSAPPNYFPWFVAAGMLIAGAMIGLVRSAEGGNRFTLFIVTAVATIWSLVAAAAGTAVLIAWLFTKHHFMGRNENLLHFDPLSLALVVLVPLSVYGLRGVSKAVKLAGFVASLSLLGFVLQGIPLFYQKNGEIIGLALPINLAVWWTVFRLSHYKRTSLPSSAAL